MKLPKQVEAYLQYQSVTRGLSQRTIISYRCDMEKLCTFMKKKRIPLEAVKRKHILAFMQYVAEIGMGEASANRIISSTRGLYLYFRRAGLMKDDPCYGVDNVKIPENLPRFLFEAEANRLVDSATPTDPIRRRLPAFYALRDRALLEVLYSSGARVHEATQMRLDGLNLEKGRARVWGKGSKERVVFLGPAAVRELRLYLEARAELIAKPMQPEKGVHLGKSRKNGAMRKRQDSPFVFVNNRGQGLSDRGVEQMLEKYIEKSGVHRITPHGLRHTLATTLWRHGLDIRYIQEILGHSSVSTTVRYTHTDSARIREIYDKAFPHAGLRKSSTPAGAEGEALPGPALQPEPSRVPPCLPPPIHLIFSGTHPSAG